MVYIEYRVRQGGLPVRALHASSKEREDMSRKVGPQGRSTSSARERAYLQIQRKIASGELSAGQAVSELALAKEIKISRTPIREALAQLAAEGILEQSPNRRAVVVKLARQDIIELYELREALEVYAVGKAARQPVRRGDLDKLQHLTDAILTLKDELDQSGKTELGQEQMQRFVAYDLGFHTLLMHLAPNARILKVVNETRLLIRIFAIRRRGHTGMQLADIHRRHSEVVRAIAEQDPYRSMRAISEHIQISQHERLDAFDQGEIEASLRETMPGMVRTDSLLLPPD